MQWNYSTDKKTIGQHWEKVAIDYLQAKGLKLIKSNFNTKYGELDLIMKDNQYLVFVEVKFRNNSRFGGAVSAVTTSKQKKILKTAQVYLQQQGLNAYNTPCRFDIVAIDGSKPIKINWLRDAF